MRPARRSSGGLSVSVYIVAISFALFVQAPNAKKLQTGGMMLTLAFLVIITPMIWQPGGAFSA